MKYHQIFKQLVIFKVNFETEEFPCNVTIKLNYKPDALLDQVTDYKF